MPPVIIITCGPASEPIDAVRRITNFSTGELGVRLAEEFISRGAKVICCKGSGATWPDPALSCEMRRFATNNDLLGILRELAAVEPVAAIFHAAALTDFQVVSVSNHNGTLLSRHKIPSSTSELTIRMVSASKILPLLRTLFPTASITGWKYELEGTQAESLEKAGRQMLDNQTDACVINGMAYGPGFGFLNSEGLLHFPDKAALCVHLAGQTFV